MSTTTKSVLDEMLERYQEQGRQFFDTQAYKEVRSRIDAYQAKLAVLAQGGSNEALILEGLQDLCELADEPTFYAEMHGFREGFRAALRLKFELMEITLT